MNALLSQPSPVSMGVQVKTAMITASVSRHAGGVFESVRRMSQCLVRDHGLQVELLGLKDEATEWDRPLWHPIEPQVFPPQGPVSFGYARGFQRALNSLETDLIHVQGLWMYPSVASSRWQRRSAKPCLISPHGMLDPWALNHARWKKRLAGLLYQNAHLRRASCLHALCEPEASALRTYGLRNPICVIPNGVDLPQEPPNHPAPWEAMIPAGAPVLLYLGRLHPKKGLPQLLRAWHKMTRTRGPAALWHLAVVGWDQDGHQKELVKLAHELGIEARVHFLGPKFGAAKAAALNHATALILPSLSEGLPMTVLEAWSWGKPVLMTAACNLPEGFEEGAALSMQSDPDAQHLALETLVSMSERDLQTMGERGRAMVASRFTWTRIAGEMKNVYEWLLGSGHKPESVRLV